MARSCGILVTMPKNRMKRPRDLAQLAKLMIDIASGEIEDRAPGDERPRGRAGGLKGGAARANALDPQKRREIARKAAAAGFAVAESRQFVAHLAHMPCLIQSSPLPAPDLPCPHDRKGAKFFYNRVACGTAT